MPSVVPIAAVFFCGLVVSHVAAFSEAPSYTMDLDQKPEDRWTGAVNLVLQKYGYEHSFKSMVEGSKFIFDLLPADTVDVLTDALKTRYPENYWEMMGIAKALEKAGYAQNRSFIVQMPFYYELFHIQRHPSMMRRLTPKQREAVEQFGKACTGILTLPQDKTKNILHGRNMDMQPPSGRNLTLNISVVKGGKLQYYFFDWVWICTGTATGLNPGHLTLEINVKHGYNAADWVIGRLANTSVPCAFAPRQVLHGKMGIEAATKFFMESDFAAPMYLIMSGAKRRGVVLSINVNQSMSRNLTLDDSTEQTFVVQTNYDHWLPDPTSDPRRTVAHDALMLEGPEVRGTDLGLWMALGVFPVHNQGTYFTLLMSIDRFPYGFKRVPMKPADE